MACNKESDAVIDDGGERCVAGGARGAGGARIAIASESKQAGATPRPGALKSYYPRPHTSAAPAPHTSFECASLWRRPGPCMILVRVRLISGRLNLTRRRRRLAREIKTGSGPEGAIDPRAFVRGRPATAYTARRCHTANSPCLVYTVILQHVTYEYNPIPIYGIESYIKV